MWMVVHIHLLWPEYAVSGISLDSFLTVKGASVSIKVQELYEELCGVTVKHGAVE